MLAATSLRLTSSFDARSATLDRMLSRLAPFALLCSAICAAAPPPKCKTSDIPVRVTFSTVYDPTGEPSRVNNDTPMAYEDGVDGIYAKIQRCNGTNDLLVSTLTSDPERPARLDLGLGLHSNSNTPTTRSWPGWPNVVTSFRIEFNDFFHGYSELVPYS